MTGSQIEVRRFSYRYPQLGSQWALRNIEAQINAGEYVLLCGASGSGKSTLVRALTGLIPHGYDGVIEGSIVIDGVDTRSRPLAEWLMTVGVVFQSPQWQLFNSTVTRELAFGLESLGCQRQVMRQRIDAVAAQLGIEHLLERNPQQLSAGEQLLVALGTVLVVGARIIVLDEPFANLDGMHVAQVQAILRTLHQQGVTIIVAEHRLGLVAADATRMIVLHEGQIVLDGRPADVLAHDIRRFHLEPPLPTQIGRVLGLDPLPLTVEALLARVDRQQFMEVYQPSVVTLQRGNGSPLLRTHQLTYAIGQRQLLDSIDLQVHAGESVAIVGANGAGKTTLIKHFNGLYRPQHGRVNVLGRDTRTTPVSELARSVGMVFQHPDDQLFCASVRDEVAIGARVMGVFDPARLRDVLQALQLEPLADRSPFALSAGEKRRLTLAAAMLIDPPILVLDEPTTGLDWPARQTLATYIREQTAAGRTIVMVTHDLDFAGMVSSRWLVMAGGRLIADDSPLAIVSDPACIATAKLLLPERYRLALALQSSDSASTTMIRQDEVPYAGSAN
ncbi:ABC transporter ATP-binding protein [Chloroflexus sp. MS-CIW-1]|uniref:ABC transporter ATP-binding protein n=1 Tax=Chloroflexus sp. MS-CIW-1 TaxID=3055768 RepID=UPI002649DD4C|nr:ABC transporter ATP-binding protein [Chloroflexus sp. MS-CIW-1]MDN5273850.1 ABC transporter ATP-binding protein [Chloroflexus sp. MS-CIW-1]